MQYFGPKSGKNQKFIESHIFSDDTAKTYLSKIKEFTNFIYNEYGITDVHFLKPLMSEAFINSKIEDVLSGKSAVSTVKSTIHALEKYQNIVRNQLHFRARIINTPKMLDQMKARDLYRSSEITRKSLKITPEQAQNMINELANTNKQVARIAEFAFQTGSRISAILRIEVKHLDFNKNTVKFVGDKGNKTRVVTVDPNYMQNFKKEIEGKSSGRQVFELRDKKGQLLSIEKGRRYVERCVAKISDRLGYSTRIKNKTTKRATPV